MMDMLGGLYALFFCLLLIKLANVIRNSFLNEDFRQSFVKILVNPSRIHCVLCLSLTKICNSKNLRPESEDFLLNFWMLRTKKGWRLSRAKRRKDLKKNSFRLFRIILANLISDFYTNLINYIFYNNYIIKSRFFKKKYSVCGDRRCISDT